MPLFDDPNGKGNHRKDEGDAIESKLLCEALAAAFIVAFSTLVSHGSSA